MRQLASFSIISIPWIGEKARQRGPPEEWENMNTKEIKIKKKQHKHRAMVLFFFGKTDNDLEHYEIILHHETSPSITDYWPKS